MNKGNLDKDEAKKIILTITNGGDIKNNLDCLFLYKQCSAKNILIRICRI